MVEPVDEAAIEQAFGELDSLADKEYDATFAEVAADPDAQLAALRVGRLIGVTLKQPFADPYKIDPSTSVTGARRGWALVKDEATFDSRSDVWQYEALAQIRGEVAPDSSIYQFAVTAQGESAFFSFFARAVGRYICGDKEIRDKVEEALKEAEKAGAKPITPEQIVGAGGLGLGVLLVSVVPFLGFVGAPVIAGLVVVIYRLGVEGFCGLASKHLSGLES